MVQNDFGWWEIYTVSVKIICHKETCDELQDRAQKYKAFLKETYFSPLSIFLVCLNKN